MSENCQLVVFSNKAYNAIIRESFDKDPVETGGILLGHILDNGVWIVMEVLPPGINSIFEYAYFEYDEDFVNYLAQSVANQYKRPLDLLGLWHRHPGNMDHFSTTDDGTNATFARQNPAGVISGLVNIDPQFRLTMYHMDRPSGRLMGRPNYETVEVEVGDDIIPEEYFELRYYDGENSNLHPMVSDRQRNIRPRQVETPNGRHTQPTYQNPEQGSLDIVETISNQLPPCDEPRRATPKSIDDFFSFWRASNKKWMYILLAIVVLIIGAFTIRSCKDNIEGMSKWVSSLSDKAKTDKDKSQEGNPSLSKESITLSKVGATDVIKVNGTNQNIIWKSSNSNVATVDNGMVTAVANGSTMITAQIGEQEIGRCTVSVEIPVIETDNEVFGENDKNLKDGEAESESTDIKDVIKAIIDKSKTYKGGNSGILKLGDSPYQIPLIVTGNPTVTFVCSNDSVAKVDGNGKVTPLKVGTADIAILCNGQKSDTYKITVSAK